MEIWQIRSSMRNANTKKRNGQRAGNKKRADWISKWKKKAVIPGMKMKLQGTQGKINWNEI